MGHVAVRARSERIESRGYIYQVRCNPEIVALAELAGRGGRLSVKVFILSQCMFFWVKY